MLLHFSGVCFYRFWATFLAETSKDLEIILITIVLSFTNSLSRTSLYFYRWNLEMAFICMAKSID